MRGTRNNQLVAWRFIVERSGTGPWNFQVTYRSPNQWGTAHTDSPALFSRMSVPVNVPDGDTFFYRVKVKMFWYRRDGSIQGTGVHRVDYNRSTPPDAAFEGPCSTSQPPD
jgi:hypothetical protein